MSENGPNSNITQINAIEGLISQVNEHLSKLEAKGGAQGFRKVEAQRAITNLQNDELHSLRRVFE